MFHIDPHFASQALGVFGLMFFGVIIIIFVVMSKQAGGKGKQ